MPPGVLLRFVALAYSRNSSVVAGNFERPAFFNAELRAPLRLPGRGLRPGLAPFEQRRTGECAGCGKRGRALHQGAAGEHGHGSVSSVVTRRDVARLARRTNAPVVDLA